MQAILTWVEDFLFLVLGMSFLEMLLPSSETKPFIKWLMGLVVLAFFLQSVGSIKGQFDLFEWERWSSEPTHISTEPIVIMGQKIAKGGEKPVIDAVQNEYNHNVKSMLLVMDGVRDAEVVTQLGSQGEIKHVIAKVTTTDAAVAKENPSEEHLGVRIVEPIHVIPVAVGLGTGMAGEQYGEQDLNETGREGTRLVLEAKVRKFIATYYQVPESAVKVIVH